MSHAVKKFLDSIDAIADKSGRIFCYLVFIIMLITALDVVARYVFNHPLLWGWVLNRQLFGVFILFAGVYTLYTGGHISIEIFYDRFSPKGKTIARFFALAAFLGFMGVLLWQTIWMGWNSFQMNEKAAGAFRIPLYPFKILIPVVVLLFLLVGISAFRRDKD
jgi:TRAP-type mannitol/chloroaromatic compound transport system permease small subunit